MYLEHFSLQVKPFELLPDPEFLFLSDVHRKALTFLEYGLLENTGFILLTGEVGAGKTTLIRRLLEKIPTSITISKIFNTQVSPAQLLRMINDDFGIVSAATDKTAILRELNDFLITQYGANKRSILIIDEAQNLGLEQLEEVRLLSNLETSHQKLLQIVLVGQPELRDKLGSPELIQLRQRILVHCHLSPLNAQETESYVLHRLEQAGNRSALRWQPGAMECVHAASRGVPRVVNILCHYILLDAFSNSTHDVTVESVQAILHHLDFEAQFWPEAATEAANASEAVSAAPGSGDVAVLLETLGSITENLCQTAETLLQTARTLSDALLATLESHAELSAKERRKSGIWRR